MNPAHWYRKCPTCGGSFGRGKGAGGLARHGCDNPLVIELRAKVVALLQASLGHSIIEARLKKRLRDREGRLSLVAYLLREQELQMRGRMQAAVVDRAVNLRCRDWRLEV